MVMSSDALLEDLSLFDRAMVTPGGCWEWTGCLDNKGYGRIGHRGQKLLVHRTVYEAVVGEIPKGMWVLHRCDNPPCCNLAHLFVDTAQANVDDMIAKGRHVAPRGEANGKAILTTHQVHEIRRLIAEGWRSCDLARRFNVGPNAIWSIKSGRTWAWLMPKADDIGEDELIDGFLDIEGTTNMSVNQDTSLLTLILMSLPKLSTPEIDLLIQAAQATKQRQADDVMVRNIREDARRSPPSQPSSAMGDVDAPRHGPTHQHLRQGPTHKGWVDAPRIDDWQRQVGIGRVDALMDQQDRIDRAKLKGGR
jgi:hypothetical protein